MVKDKTDIIELSSKVLEGVTKALQILVETSAANNEDLIVGDAQGNFKSVPAKELFKELQSWKKEKRNPYQGFWSGSQA